MPNLTFSATIAINGVNPYVPIDKLQAAQLKADWHRPMPVLVQINGQPLEPWPINMMPAGGGDFYLYLHGDVRKASGTRVGDVVTVNIGFDNNYKTGPGPLPDWFSQALADNQTALDNWQRLSSSRQKEVVRRFAQLKSPEVQAKNLERVMNILSGNDGQFMGRAWHNGA